MSGEIWWTIGGCIVLASLTKAFGPVVMGGRELSPRLDGVIVLMAPALLAALVVTSAVVDDGRIHVGADTIGVAVGGGVILLTRGGVLTAVVVAAAVTALLRLAT